MQISFWMCSMLYLFFSTFKVLAWILPLNPATDAAVLSRCDMFACHCYCFISTMRYSLVCADFCIFSSAYSLAWAYVSVKCFNCSVSFTCQQDCIVLYLACSQASSAFPVPQQVVSVLPQNHSCVFFLSL